MEVIVDAANFDEVVLKSEKPVMVDFYATWCGPCKMMAPVVERIAEAYEGKAVIAKLDIDEAIEIAQRYRIMSVPSFVFFRNGEVVDTVIGAVNEKELTSRLEER